MTLFGDKIFDWIGSLFSGSKAIDNVVKSYKQLHDAHKAGIQDAQAELTTTKLLYRATQDKNKSMDERLAAVNELQAKYPSFLGNMSDEEILAGKAGEQYRQRKNTLLMQPSKGVFG